MWDVGWGMLDGGCGMGDVGKRENSVGNFAIDNLLNQKYFPITINTSTINQ
jgi:hypothetical protein